MTTSMLVVTYDNKYITEQQIVFLAGSCRIFYTHKNGETDRHDGFVEIAIEHIISIEIHQYQ